eukprot:6489163-Pyramimonas_sp.AAC.1
MSRKRIVACVVRVFDVVNMGVVFVVHMGWGCAACTKPARCRSTIDDEEWKVAEIILARRGCIPAPIQGLRRPPRPAGAAPFQCQWRSEIFANITQTAGHERACVPVPYDMWIARSRHCLSTQKDPSVCRMHCYTCFQTTRGAVQHEKNCAQMREFAGRPLNQGATQQRMQRSCDLWVLVGIP